jgi:rod shape-determining protein MreB
MAGLFQPTILYVRIRKNQFDIRNLATDQRSIARSLNGFSSERLLIANFSEAEATLAKAVKEMAKPGLFQSPPSFVLMHPLEIISGGISEVEDRVLRDLAAICGRSGDVWVGDELSDEEVVKRARRT